MVCLAVQHFPTLSHKRHDFKEKKIHISWSRFLLEKVTPFSASQEIPQFFWNPKVHYRIYKCPSPAPILSQIDPVHTPTFHFLKIHLNIILPYLPGSSKWSPFLGSPPKTLYTHLLSPIHAICPAHLILPDFITGIIFGEEYRSLRRKSY